MLATNQEIENIYLQVADNGGAVLNYTIVTKEKNNEGETNTDWDSKTEVFTTEEIQTNLMARMIELIEADIAVKFGAKNPTNPSMTRGIIAASKK